MASVSRKGFSGATGAVLCLCVLLALVGGAAPPPTPKPVAPATTTTTVKPKTRLIEREEVLSESLDFKLKWTADLDTQIIKFVISAKTHGYLAIGLNTVGQMEGADIMIGRVHQNGRAYANDYHGIGNTMPVQDVNPNWFLDSAMQNESHTVVNVSRAFDTCDTFSDVVINNDTLFLIWAVGTEDEPSYHNGNRGSMVLNLLDPPYPTTSFQNLTHSALIEEIDMPNTTFSYWCSLHKFPSMNSTKRHIVGYSPILDGGNSTKHTHHFVLYRCNASITEVVKSDHCYTKGSSFSKIRQSCMETLYIWGTGGRPLTLPDNVGYPFLGNETYMLEIHLDNPNELSGVRFNSGVEVLYTSQLRKFDVGMLAVGHATLPSILIPPSTKNWIVHGHCSPDCSKYFVPPTGIWIINVMLHTHRIGQQMKLRQFRNQTELAWVASDLRYHFSFQKNRPLKEERLFLPGDQLTYECTYSSLNRTNVTLGGFATNNEMCMVFLYYYPALEGALSCTSFIPVEDVYQKLGFNDTLNNTTPDFGVGPLFPDPVNNGTNISLSDMLNTRFQWTPEVVKDLNHFMMTTPQRSACTAQPYVPQVIVIPVTPPGKPADPKATTLATTTIATTTTTQKSLESVAVNIPVQTTLYWPPESVCLRDELHHRKMYNHKNITEATYYGKNTSTPAENSSNYLITDYNVFYIYLALVLIYLSF